MRQIWFNTPRPHGSISTCRISYNLKVEWSSYPLSLSLSSVKFCRFADGSVFVPLEECLLAPYMYCSARQSNSVYEKDLMWVICGWRSWSQNTKIAYYYLESIRKRELRRARGLSARTMENTKVIVLWQAKWYPQGIAEPSPLTPDTWSLLNRISYSLF